MFEEMHGLVYVDGKKVPGAYDMADYYVELPTTFFWKRGFRVTFENGLILSTGWGTGMYCEMRSKRGTSLRSSPDAEIAAWWHDDAQFVKLTEHDDVLGWVKPDEWWRFFTEMQTWTKDKTTAGALWKGQH